MRSKINIVKQHHEVLYAWAELRHSLGTAPAVWSLDTHTDTMPCFRSARTAPPEGEWQSPGAVSQAVNHLRHDEHFDWALRAGLISRASILALLPGELPPAHPEIRVHTPADFPGSDVILNDAEKFRPFAENMLNSDFLRRSFGDDLPGDEPFILDIDCDYFYCQKALSGENADLFLSMAHRAALITISEENEWVKLLRLPGENITGSSIAERLTELFLSSTP